MPFLSCTQNTAQQAAIAASQAAQDAAIAALQAAPGTTPASVLTAVNAMSPAQIAAMCSALNCAPTAAALTTALLSLSGSGVAGNVLTIVSGVPVWQAPATGAASSVPASGVTAGTFDAGVQINATEVLGLCAEVQTCLATATLPAAQLSGVIAAANLPSYVDDVLEFANLAAFPVTGQAGKIYVTADTNKVYRWSGSAYVEMSAGSGSALTVPASGVTAGSLGASVIPTNVAGGALAGSYPNPTLSAAGLAAASAAAAITAKDEGVNLTTQMTSIDFVGAGVTATNTSGNVIVTIPSGGIVYGTAAQTAAIGVGAPTAAPTTATPATRIVNTNGEVFDWNGSGWFLAGNGYLQTAILAASTPMPSGVLLDALSLVATRSGKYLISGAAHISANSTSYFNYAGAFLTLNGAGIARIGLINSPTAFFADAEFNGSVVVTLVAGDVIALRLIQINSGDAQVPPSLTQLQILAV